jgi:hypothetical protein
MTPAQKMYRAAICQALEAHLTRVKAARRTRDLAVSKAKDFGWHDLRRPAVYADANEQYEKALRDSDAQRAKDDAAAWAAFKATGEAD